MDTGEYTEASLTVSVYLNEPDGIKNKNPVQVIYRFPKMLSLSKFALDKSNPAAQPTWPLA